MGRDADWRALRDALGESALATEAPLEQAGVRLEATLRPEGPEALAEALRLLSARGLRALVRGGGSRDGLGNLPRDPDLVLSTAGLAGLHELDVDEGVLRAGAGTRLSALRGAVRATGWELPLDPPGEAATLGGTLAAAAAGPCFPRPRDAVLGLEVALASGERTRCGGRVVKNVTGYDLAKLYVGSLGSLGVIEAAWLRLRPAPERVEPWAAPLSGVAADAERVLAASRRSTVRAALHLDRALARAVLPDAEGELLLLELAGDSPAVAEDAERLASGLGATPVPAEALERARELAAERPASGPGAELRLRVTALPSRVEPAAAALAAAGAALLRWPAHGQLLAWLPLASPAADAQVARAFEAGRCAARAGGGSFCVESAPAWAKRGRDVFGDIGTPLALARALKQQFDPGGVLNAGRVAGWL